MSPNKEGYLGIQWLQGYTRLHECDAPVVCELALLLDLWIEDNTSPALRLSINEDLAKRLCAEVGYEVKHLDTLLGCFPLEVHAGDAKIRVDC